MQLPRQQGGTGVLEHGRGRQPQPGDIAHPVPELDQGQRVES